MAADVPAQMRVTGRKIGERRGIRQVKSALGVKRLVRHARGGDRLRDRFVAVVDSEGSKSVPRLPLDGR
jgi:hypothetical protein